MSSNKHDVDKYKTNRLTRKRMFVFKAVMLIVTTLQQLQHSLLMQIENIPKISRVVK